MAEMEPQGVPLEGVVWGAEEEQTLGDGQLLARVALLADELRQTANSVQAPFGSPIWTAAALLYHANQSLLSEARCNLAAPPSDIRVKVNDAGDMIRRCGHEPPHEWRLDGTRL